MHRLPIVNYSFITPKTQKMCKGKTCQVYNFYHGDDYSRYLENEKEHPVHNERAYDSFNEYMSEHDTKEQDAHIKTFNNIPENAKGKAKDTIIFSTVISLDEETSEMGGFGNDKTKKRVCDYFFNQMMKFHHFDKNDWCYYAAEHTNTKHTHMHIIIYQPDTVTGEKVMDWKIKANCMTSRWVRTNTIRFTTNVVSNLNNELLTQILETKHSLQRNFKQEISKGEYHERIVELARDILETKGATGKLQYKKLEHWSKLSEKDYEKLKLKKEDAVSPTKARHILTQVDSLTDYVIKHNANLKTHISEIKNMQDEMYPTNTDDKALNLFCKDIKENYDSELKASLGNQILKEVKENASAEIFITSNQYRKEYIKLAQQLGLPLKNRGRGCREYKHCISDRAKESAQNFISHFSKTIQKAKESERQLKESIKNMSEQESREYEIQQRGLEL